jgi:hypothetical protein
MYVGRRKIGHGRLAGAHRLSGLRRSRRGLGDGFDWSGFSTTLINDAAGVASIAVKPPTYSSVVLPSGAQSITSYAPIGATSSLLGTSSLTSLFDSPVVLLGGFALVAVLLLKR